MLCLGLLLLGLVLLVDDGLLDIIEVDLSDVPPIVVQLSRDLVGGRDLDNSAIALPLRHCSFFRNTGELLLLKNLDCSKLMVSLFFLGFFSRLVHLLSHEGLAS